MTHTKMTTAAGASRREVVRGIGAAGLGLAAGAATARRARAQARGPVSLSF